MKQRRHALILTLTRQQRQEALDAYVTGGVEACTTVLQKHFPGTSTKILKETVGYIMLARIMEKR